jgi:oxalate---CoA ligase
MERETGPKGCNVTPHHCRHDKYQSMKVDFRHSATEQHIGQTIGQVIRAQAALQPEQPAMLGPQFSLSYRQLQAFIDQCYCRLRAAGFARDARIAVALTDSAQAALAIAAIGSSAVAVPLDPKLRRAEVQRCLRILHPQALLALQGSESAARAVAESDCIPIIEVTSSTSNGLNLQLSVPQIGPGAPLDEPDHDAPVFILHTSGTTGVPNLVPFSHRNLLTATGRLRSWFELTLSDRCLNVSPVYYSHALTTTVFPPLLIGGSVAFPTHQTRVDLAEWLVALEPTWYSAGPTLNLAVLEKAQTITEIRKLHKLRFISSAGAPLLRETHETMEKVLGIPVLEHYGSSETAQLAANMLAPGRRKPGTCGMPWPGVIKIVDEDGREVPAGRSGEILVTGPSVTAGYLNAPELNRARFADGWFRTGDVGSIDQDGFLSLHGRCKELINRGGEKIAPMEIDQALLSHPEVDEAAAFSVPHPRLGEDVAAAVVLRSGATITPAELREFLSQHLATFKIPRRITVLDQLPKGITGKVLRGRLSEMVRGRGLSARQPEGQDTR